MHLRSAAAEAAGDHLKIPVDEAGHKPSRVQKTEGDLISQQIERHRSALAERPNHADIHYRLGLLLRNRGQAEEAIGCYQRAVAINPSYMKALIKLGLALKEVGRDAEAEAIFVQATELHPEYADLHYQLGLLFVQRQQFELAVERFAQAAERNPQNIEFQANLALALQNMALVDRAKATWQIVQELAPADSPFALQARGALARKKGT
jgi:tetratricopeptide (TPR) repeat protein